MQGKPEGFIPQDCEFLFSDPICGTVCLHPMGKYSSVTQIPADSSRPISCLLGNVRSATWNKRRERKTFLMTKKKQKTNKLTHKEHLTERQN